VLTIPQTDGKISAEKVEEVLNTFKEDGNRAHMVMPGMVYISQPTEYGTLYNRQELEALSKVCRSNGIPLYLDGARLAYALACSENQLTLADIARLCDIFYIGGTKCGALFGEAVVIPKPGLIPHFFTIIKQHGALLAKGRLLGIQFDTLFTDSLYEKVGAPAIQAADQIRKTLKEQNFSLCFGSPTNQVFCIVDDALMTRLEKQVEFGFWEKYDDTHTVIRFATSWATTKEDVDALCNLLCNL
jgi:threonine aldolase